MKNTKIYTQTPYNLAENLSNFSMKNVNIAVLFFNFLLVSEGIPTNVK